MSPNLLEGSMKHLLTALTVVLLAATTGYAKSIACTNLGLSMTQKVIITDNHILEFNSAEERVIKNQLSHEEKKYRNYNLRTDQSGYNAILDLSAGLTKPRLVTRDNCSENSTFSAICVEL
jgi:hypothetical protein